MLRTPGQWMTQQQQAGRRLCLILEGNSNARQPLMAPRNLGQCCSLYGGSAVAALAADGPVILLVEQFDEPALVGLLEHPEMNWGWLGSLPDADLGDVIEHWQARMLVGPPGNQALYRFHDNRTLGRALTSVPVAQWPAYLGPLISVCYWHEEQWCCANNPAPGKYPIPDPAPWLNIPNPQASAILQANILRYLLAEHSESLAALVEFQDPGGMAGPGTGRGPQLAMVRRSATGVFGGAAFGRGNRAQGDSVAAAEGGGAGGTLQAGG